MSNVKLLEVKPEEFDENFAYRFKALMSNVKQRKGRKMKKLLKSFKALMSNVKPFIGGTRMKNSVVSKL